MFDLTNFRLRDMVECSVPLRDLGDDSGSLAELAQRTVHHLHDGFRDADGNRSCALVRFFKTHRYAQLDPDLRSAADRAMGHAPEDPTIPCLTLLGSAGDRPEWNDPARSEGHRVIPLPSERMVERFPMISQLIKQLGLDVARIIRPNTRLMV
ncbi:MAG: hypothetical protein HKN12_11955, partial [Gemmatimonadetes bacterium]|nr:hypothetical protein [Gemmatimonadota bacterium]